MDKLPEIIRQEKLEINRLNRENGARRQKLMKFKRENQNLNEEYQNKLIQNRKAREEYVLFRGHLELIRDNLPEEEGACCANAKKMLDDLLQSPESPSQTQYQNTTNDGSCGANGNVLYNQQSLSDNQQYRNNTYDDYNQQSLSDNQQYRSDTHDNHYF